MSVVQWPTVCHLSLYFLDVSEKEDEAEEKKNPSEQQQTQTKTGKKRKSLTEPSANAKKKKKAAPLGPKEGLVVQEKKVQEDADSKAANPKKRKRKKKTITEVLAISEPQPGCPADLQNMVEEQVKLLQKGVTHIGVGTPGRLQALIERDEGLTLQSLSYLVLDWNWRDQKSHQTGPPEAARLGGIPRMQGRKGQNRPLLSVSG
ncbi:hypothetical protein CRUP_031969 [Coryphaenoides rupestris]|nr:hypothetical protein CRUP_031969 [Coryphaenoides rupestris]